MKNKLLVLFIVGILMSSFLATTVKANNAKFVSSEKTLKANTVSANLEIQNNNDSENENNTVENESNEENEIEDENLASPVDNIPSPTPEPTSTPSPSASPSPTASNTLTLTAIDNNNPQNNQKTLGNLLRQMMDMIKRILATN